MSTRRPQRRKPRHLCTSAQNFPSEYEAISRKSLATYKNGRWANATQIPGLAALDTAKNSAVHSVSYTPAGLATQSAELLDDRWQGPSHAGLLCVNARN
jgi:hypothetical protein